MGGTDERLNEAAIAAASRLHADESSVCPACGARNPHSSRYCGACGAPMYVDSGEQRAVTVLFADLSGFTAFSESADPETVRAVAETAARRFGEIITRAGGTVDKVIGDCVMATFGTPIAADDDALRAVRAALAIQEEAARHRSDLGGLHVSIGLMSGTAIYAPVGAGGGYTVLGETVDLAAQLQSAARPGEVVIGESTRDAVGGSIRTESVPPLVRRTGDPVRAWRALDDAIAVPGTSHVSLIGREYELERLRELWERVDLDHRTFVVTMRGPARSGGRSLARMFAHQLPDAGVLTVDLSSTTAIWTDLILAVAMIERDDRGEVAGKKLAVLLDRVGLGPLAASLEQLVTGAGEDPTAQADAWRVLTALSLVQPLVILFEQAHEGHSDVMRSIDELASSDLESRILVIVCHESAAPAPAEAGKRRRMIRLLPPPNLAFIDDEAGHVRAPPYVPPPPARSHMDEGPSACPSCGSENPHTAQFCIHCGSRTAAERGERRTVTVLFADVRGFVRLAGCSDTSVVRDTADRVIERLARSVDAHGGTLDKVISENGLKVMAVFGAPIAHEDDPERAVRAAFQMQATAAQEFAADTLALAVGIMTGEAIYAPVGPSGRYTVLGDTVNTAARLQSAASQGDILIGGPTAVALNGVVTLEPIAPIRAKGKREPVPAWRAIASTAAPRPRARRRAIVGRRVELEMLNEIWARARTQRLRMLATIVGGAGVGKSTLVGAFKRAVRDKASVHSGHCLPYGEGITYWPLVEIIKDAAGILHDDAIEVASGKLGGLLESVGIDDLDQLRTIAVAVAHLVAAPTTPRGTYQATEISRAELHWGLRRLLELLARRQPLVLIFEDLHWAEETLLAFLDELLAESGQAPLMIIASAREAFIDRYPPLLDPAMNRRVISLGPLSADESAQLIASRITASANTLEPLLAAAGGNPLYLEEIVAMLIDRGVVDRTGRLVGDPSMVTVPDSLQGLIDARIDQLEPTERSVAGHASVVGRVFWDGALTSIGERDPIPTLRSLAERDVVQPMAASTIAGESEYAFKHILLRDVTYGRIPKAERATMHQRCAAWIAGLPGPRDEFVEFVAYHLEQACRLALDVADGVTRAPTLRAVDALMRAARKAENHEGTEEADRYYARALENLRDGFPETRTELYLERADTRALLGDLEGSLDLLRTVRDMADELGRTDLRCRATLQLANLVAMGSTSEARALLTEAEQLAQMLEDRRLQIEQALTSGFLRAIYEGAPDAAIVEMSSARDAAAEFGDTMLLIAAHQRLGNLLMNAGRLAEAEQQFSAAAALAHSEGSIREETEATRFLATIKYYRGPRDEAERLAHQALAWLERNPNRIVEVQTRCRVAWLAIARGALAEADGQLREARALADRIGGWMRVEVLKNVALLATLQGRHAEVERAAREARAAVPEGDEYADGSACVAEGVAAAQMRDQIRARERFDRAIRLLASEPLDQGLAYIWFARTLGGFGGNEEARLSLDAARAIYAPMDAAAMLDDIARLSV